MDRTDGKVLLAHKFVRRLTWASGVGPDGRPQLLPSYLPPPEGEETCPEDATNWNSTAFSPATRRYFVMSLEAAGSMLRPAAPAHASASQTKLEEIPQKYLRAIDIDSGKVVWEIPQFGTVFPKTWPGVLATAGGLVFYGDPNGAFAAVDEEHGKPLWHFPTNVPMKGSPMTYTVDDRQYVAVVAGPNIMCFGLPQQ